MTRNQGPVMMTSGKLAGLLLAGGLLAAVLAAPPPAAAAMSADQVKAKIAEAYGVEVMKVRPGEVDGRPVFFVTVMNPGGDFNEAFQINTLVVDAETGNLLPGFRHRSSGYDPNQAPSYSPNLHSPDTLSWGFIWR